MTKYEGKMKKYERKMKKCVGICRQYEGNMKKEYIGRRTWKIPGLPAGGGNLTRTRT